MRIVYCINGLFNMGGIERVVSNKANYLVSRGYEVHIVTTEQMNWPLAFPLNSKVTCHDLGINYSSRVHSSYIAKIYHYLRNTLLHKYRLRNLLLNLKPDIVISTFGYESYLLPSIKGESSKILEFHFSYAMFQKAQKRRGVLGFFDKFLTRRMLNAIKRYDRFVVLTRRDSLDWYKWYECDNIEIIPNAQTFACESPAPLDNKKVIAVGRYTYEKGFDRLVQAWELVNLKTQGWTLHLLGDGKERENLQAQINRLGLQDRVFLDGIKSNIQDEYRDASFLVSSSRWEGFPMVILEAESTGIPVIAFDCPCGPSDLIADGENGFLVADGDIDKLADRIIYLIEHSGKRKEMGRKAFESARKYSQENVIKMWTDLFDELSAKGKK